MAKILLVEDDNNLREIYEARLQAEGYDIVSAKDGEEALVVAKKERPDLIIADVMMPRVSGFEMLDILRNTPELKEVHVIMLTALGQAEDKTRADSLGADRYLVKSQVTLEDIVKAAADVLAGAPASTPAMAAAATDGAQTATPAPAIPVATPPTASTDATSTTPAPVAPLQDLPTPQLQPPVAPPNISTPVAAPSANQTPAVAATNPPANPTSSTFSLSPAPVPTTSAPAAQTPLQTSPPASIPEPSAADSQLVTDAVNNLVAGTDNSAQNSSVPTSAPTEPSAQQPPNQTPPTVPPAPAPTLTMQPVVAPPAPAPVAPAQTMDTVTITPPSARKAIQPPAPGTVPGQSDLNELMAKEGHSLNDGDGAPQIFSGSHMPGNVISPGAEGQNPPSPQAPVDPNSISL